VIEADGHSMAWAGPWDAYRWPDGRIEKTYCVITIEANGLIEPIHDRMPLVLEHRDWPLWLGEMPGDPAALLRRVPVLWCVPAGIGRRSTRRGGHV
jgi:putative SOS response-associated peptidase YedK